MPRSPDAEKSATDRHDGSLLSDAALLVRLAWDFSPRKMALQTVLLLLNGVVGGVSLLLLIPIVNSVAQSGASIPVPLVNSVELSTFPLPALLIAFVLLVCLSSIITWWSSVNAMSLQQTVIDDLRQDAFDAILAARWEFALARRNSDVIELVTTGAARSGIAFYHLLRLLVTAILFTATAIVALVVSPAVTSLALLGVLVLGAAQGSAVRVSHRLGRSFGLRNRQLQAVMTDSMDSLRLVRAHSAGAIWAQRLGDAFGGTRAVQIAQTRRSAAINAFSAVGLAMAASALVYIAVRMQVPPTVIVVVLLLVARMARQMQSMTSTAASLANSLPAVRDLTELTTTARAEAEVASDQPTSRDVLSSDASLPIVTLRDVTYHYPDSDDGISHVSFTIPRAQITAISGPSGAGKSTTADLILGLLMPQSGQVLIDDLPLRPEDLHWWRSHIAYVPQDTVLIPGTLRENLTWSASGVTDQQCWQALDRAAAGFVRTLPDGLDTIVGHRGVRLSGGERQRIAIARALLRNPAVLVMDEATSALDDTTETQVLSLVRNLTPAVTVVIIAHRRSTIDLADRVVRFARGRVSLPQSEEESHGVEVPGPS